MTRCVFTYCAAVSLTFVFCPLALADDGTWNLPGGGNWFDPANWSGGVPGAGDTAIFDALPAAEATINLNGPVSAGSLAIDNEHMLTFTGGRLAFDTLDPLVAASLLLGSNQSRVVLESDVTLQSDLIIDAILNSVLTISGSLSGGSASITKSGEGTVQITGNNSAWSGDFVLNDGIVVVGHANGLGDTTGQTIVNGGRLQLDAPSFEPITLTGGEIRMTGGVHSSAISASGGTITVISGSLSETVALSGGTTTISGSNFSLNGGTTGNGDLILGDSQASLQLNAPLAHSGSTTLRGSVRALIGGDLFSGGPLTIDGGQLEINSGAAEMLHIDQLTLRGNGSITSDGLNPSAGISFGQFVGMFGTVDVILRGDGALLKDSDGTVILNHANSYSGQTIVNAGTLIVENGGGLGTTAGDTIIRAGGTLKLKRSTAEPFVFEGGRLLLEQNDIVLSGPIDLATGGTIRAISSGDDVEILGPIIGAGDLIFDGVVGADIEIVGTNTYTGHTFIRGGRVAATNSSSLGDAASGTTIQGGFLFLRAPSSEPIRVESGGLSIDIPAEEFTGELILAGGALGLPAGTYSRPLVLESPGGTVIGSSQTTLAGGSTGSGRLELVGRGFKINAPLAHDGDLVIDGPELNTANFYTGETIVRGESIVNHPDALGTSTTPIRIEEGILILNAIPSGNRDFVVERGWIDVRTSTPSIDGTIVLGTPEGCCDQIISGVGVFTGEIRLDGTGDHFIFGGTFNGTIIGQAELTLGDVDASQINLNAANAIDGGVIIRNGTVNVNHEQALNLSKTVLQEGRLNLNVPANGPIVTLGGTLSLNVPQEISFPWMLNSGTLATSTEIGMSQLIMLDDGGLSVEGEGQIRIDDELRVMRSGLIQDGLSGDGVIRSFGSQLTLDGDLTNFNGDIRLENGQLILGHEVSLGNTPGEIHVLDRNNAHVLVFDDPIIERDIFLHNAHGPNNNGALKETFNGIPRLRGRLDVGDEGSTIANDFIMEGTLTGRNLTLRRSGFFIHTPQDQLTGDIRVVSSSLIFAEQGRLDGVDAIVLEKGGQIRTGPLSETPLDIVDDSILIRSRGGRIVHHGLFEESGPESFGVLHLERGRTTVITLGDHGLTTFEELVRAPGTTLFFDDDASRGRLGRISFANPPALNNGMIGPWAYTEDGFATIGPSGTVETLAPTASDLNAAGPTDHVRITTAQTLASDATISSLLMDSGPPIDLNGNRLTIQSGGLIGPAVISGGELTAGANTAAELVISRGFSQISADIVDNLGAPVSVVVNTADSVMLSGTNSYTGGTWVIGNLDSTSGIEGELKIMDLAAVPPNDRVYLHTADYFLYDLSAIGESVQLAELHLLEGSRVRGAQSINASQYFLEDGSINVSLKGSGTIIKDSDGLVELLTEGPDFSGSVLIRDGMLGAKENALGTASIVVEGGQLRSYGGIRVMNNQIILQGGALSGGRFAGNVRVDTDSSLLGFGQTELLGRLSGTGNLMIRGSSVMNDFNQPFVYLGGSNRRFSGDISVDSGTLRLGTSNAAGTSDISVARGARLTLGDLRFDSLITVPNRIDLFGGALITAESHRAVITGDVTVHGEALIGAESMDGLQINGRLILLDDSRVIGVGKLLQRRVRLPAPDEILVDVSGDLLVGANTSWNLLISSVAITGTIVSDAQDASLDFIGSPSLIYLDDMSLQVRAGQSLIILQNGEATPIALTGNGNFIGGNGTLKNDLSVIESASISSGDSAGLLAIDGDATIGEGGRFVVELGGLLRGDEYDALDVLGQATLEGLLEVSMLGDFSPALGDTFDVLFAEDGVIGTLSMLTTFPSFDGRTLEADYSANGLQLEVVVDLCIAGDTAPCDGVINIPDLNNVRNHFGTGDGVDRSGIPGDAFPYDGLVNINDLNAVRNNFGAGAPVPEPSTLALALLFAFVGIIAKWRRS